MEELARAVEALVMVSDGPVEPSFLAEFLEVPAARIEQLCDELARGYADEDRGFVLVRVAGGYRYQSHPDLAPYLERYVLEGQNARLSPAAMETLAIVAYKQPVSRAQVAAIRGVNADAAMRTLAQRGYICEVGRDPGPGQAVLYGTTTLLLERLGIDSVADLPPLADFVPGPEIMEALEQGLLADRRAARNTPDDEAPNDVQPDDVQPEAVQPKAVQPDEVRADGAEPDDVRADGAEPEEGPPDEGPPPTPGDAVSG